MTETTTTTTTTTENNNNHDKGDNNDKDSNKDKNNNGVAAVAGGYWWHWGRTAKAVAIGVKCSYFSKLNSGCFWLIRRGGGGRQKAKSMHPEKLTYVGINLKMLAKKNCLKPKYQLVHIIYPKDY